MSNQIEMFNSMPTTAPYSEPTASKQAAKKIAPKLPNARERVYELLKSIGKHGATGSEIASHLKMNLYTAKPRLTELSKAGLIEKTGEMRLNEHGNSEIIWRVK